MAKSGKTKLTTRTVAAMKCPAGTPNSGIWIADSQDPGFAVRVYPSGKKSFVLRYRIGRERRFMDLGPFGEGGLAPDEARKEAKRLLALVANGKDPADEKVKAREDPTLTEWVEKHIGRKLLAGKRTRDDRRYLGFFVEDYGTGKLKAVTKRSIEKFLDRFATTPVQSDRALAAVRSCLTAAVKAGELDANPALQITPQHADQERDRVLNDEELIRLLTAVEQEEPQIQAIFMLLLTTGCRISEARTIAWADLDLERGVWTLPAGKVKSRRQQALPLPAVAVTELLGLARVGPYVFPGASPLKPRVELGSAWDRIRERAGLADVWLHDIRRTIITRTAFDVSLIEAQKLGRHSDPRTTAKHYVVASAEGLRPAVERRAAFVVKFRKK
jgi:integrase